MSKTPRTDKLSILLLGRPWHEAYKEMTGLSKELEEQLAEAREQASILKAALWYFGNRLGSNIAEELKEALPKRIWRRINLKEVEETDGEIDE